MAQLPHSPRRSKRRAAIIAAGLCALTAVPAAGLARSEGPAKARAGAIKVAVLLPDTQSSKRWENNDRPYLDKALRAAGITPLITNANNDANTQQTQADQAITNGAKVILLVNLDSGSGAAIEAKAKAKGVKVIDYDRLTLNGSAAYYVSFDNVKVGKLQGQGLVKCLKASGANKPVVAELNGAPTDNNATLFAQGYNSVLDPLYKSGTFVKGPNQSVPKWDNQKALTIFEQMLQQRNNKIDGVLAANDGLGNAVISAVKNRHLKKIPVTGQDATVEGLQNILQGYQCMTVYKPIQKEAAAAAKLAISLAKGQKAAGVNATSDAKSHKVPSVLLTPIAVTKSNIAATVVKDKFATWAQICAGPTKPFCPKNAG